MTRVTSLVVWHVDVRTARAQTALRGRGRIRRAAIRGQWQTATITLGTLNSECKVSQLFINPVNMQLHESYDELIQIFKECTEVSPDVRPSMETLRDKLMRLHWSQTA